MDEFEEVGEDALTSNLQAPPAAVPAAAEPVVVEPVEPIEKKPEPEPKPEPKAATKNKSVVEEPKGLSAIGRSAKQQVIDKARAEKLAELRETYEREFANITSGRPKPKAYNAASLLSAKDPAAKLKEILARDRAIHTAKMKRKGMTAEEAKPAAPTRKRNAPAIVSETRAAVVKIQRDARTALQKLKTEAEAELRSIGGNISILHPIFHKKHATRGATVKSPSKSPSKSTKSKRRTASANRAAHVPAVAALNPSGAVINQMSSNNN
jgi:hypothetical protein